MRRRSERRPENRELLDLVCNSLNDDKAEDIVVIDLAGKTSIADFMVIASGRSQRQVGAIAVHLRRRLKQAGVSTGEPEGLRQCDWVLIDGGDVITHVFRPEVRRYYNLEKMWAMQLPAPESLAGDWDTQSAMA